MLRLNKDKLLRDLVLKLQYLEYSECTISIYYHYINKFLLSINIPPSKISGKNFQEYLLNFNFTSNSQKNQIISSLKFFYRKILNKKYNKIDFERPRKEKNIPTDLILNF